MGLQAVLSEAFPIESYDGQIALDFVSYEIKKPKLSMLESLREGKLFCASVCYVQIARRRRPAGRYSFHG